MLTGGPANAISFLIPPAGLGDSYSLVAANFRTGNPPPAGRDEMLLAIDSPASENMTLTQVKGWLFHVDFVTPANSTLGIGANHTPNTLITVARSLKHGQMPMASASCPSREQPPSSKLLVIKS